MKNIPFIKMTGTGNDFIVFDNRQSLFSGEEHAFFMQICQRRLAVGADGVLLVERGQSSPIRMRYYNRDGFEASMCGNAARCVAYYARKKGMVDQNNFTIEANDGIHPVSVEGKYITLEMIPPKNFKTNLNILKNSNWHEGGFITTGVPHYVIFANSIDHIDVNKEALPYRSHKKFSDGTNVNFVQLLKDNKIQVRTFERGVEGETLSCGTGCVASALIASKQHHLISPVGVKTKGGDLTVRFDPQWKSVFLAGLVEMTYEGVLQIPISKI